MRTPFLATLAIALALGLSPVGAAPFDDDDDDAEPVVPEACSGRRQISRLVDQMADDEVFVSRTYWMRGQETAGNVDGFNEDFSLVLSPDEPTDLEPKVYASVAGNDNFARNFLTGFWDLEIDPADRPARVVCIGAEIHTAGATGGLNVSAFADAPTGVGGGPDGVGQLLPTGPGSQVLTGTFRDIDVPVEWELTFQLAPTTAVPVLYDSTEAPSTVTVVTIETIETGEDDDGDDDAGGEPGPD